MTGPSPAESDREQFERELLVRIRATREAFREASGELASVREDYANMLDHPDGAHALHQAVKNERLAFQAYTRALRAFNDFVQQRRSVPSSPDAREQ